MVDGTSNLLLMPLARRGSLVQAALARQLRYCNRELYATNLNPQVAWEARHDINLAWRDRAMLPWLAGPGRGALLSRMLAGRALEHQLASNSSGGQPKKALPRPKHSVAVAAASAPRSTRLYRRSATACTRC